MSSKKPLASRWECANCGLAEKNGIALRPCSRCKLVRYCGTDCQVQHWKKGGHKRFCVPPEKRKPQPSAGGESLGLDGLVCAICIEAMAGEDFIQLTCTHKFHSRCVDSLRENSSSRVCPVCRSELSPANNVDEKPYTEAEPTLEAESVYREAIRRNPDDPNAHFDLGRVLYTKGDMLGAEKSYRLGFKKSPRDAYSNAHSNFGLVLLALGDLLGAEMEYRKAFRLDPENANPHYNFALVLQAKGDLAGAEREYREAIRLQPSDAFCAHSNLGHVLKAKGDTAGAVIKRRENVMLYPKSAQAHFALGVILFQVGDSVGAVRAYREAIKLEPSDATAYINLGLVLRATGDPSGAEVEYRKAAKLEPLCANFHFNFGLILEEKGDMRGPRGNTERPSRCTPSQKMPTSNSALDATTTSAAFWKTRGTWWALKRSTGRLSG